MEAPFQSFIEACHSKFKIDTTGSVADYIPELTKTNPEYFGISLTTLDGAVYEAGDTSSQFTIQSISKAFVFALAIKLLGRKRVEETVSVEPSGEAFNSIRLTSDNRPYNPMVNAGAIACAGLINQSKGVEAFEEIRSFMSRFAGRDLQIDKSVFESERKTGDRNRSIAWMLKNHSVLQGDVDAVLDVYFQQCSLLVSSRDLSIMAATLANGGINPLTEEQIIEPSIVASTLSVMTSSGMYDYAGQWMYRVGIPSKSGVGGGIIAALPTQFGLGTFSPRLDTYGNSVRGIKVCEEISSNFGLHLLDRRENVRSCVVNNYDIENVNSRRNRAPSEMDILSTHCKSIRIIELIGHLSLSNMDYITRQIRNCTSDIEFVILDFRRVSGIAYGAAQLLGNAASALNKENITLLLSGLVSETDLWRTIRGCATETNTVRYFSHLDDALEQAEDQIILRHGGFDHIAQNKDLHYQELLKGLSAEDIIGLEAISALRIYNEKDKIISTGDEPRSMFFLKTGMVSVKLPSGSRLASFTPGMSFGEMALLGHSRSADIIADTAVQCLELNLDAYNNFCAKNPHVTEFVLYNLSSMLANRVITLNDKIRTLNE